ncbi:G2/M phase-specific E3 ubiquitin-protein ligase, partial [Chaetura pelagica]
CMLCGRAEADPDTCGPLLEEDGILVHGFCLYFANELFQTSSHITTEGFVSFPLTDVRHTIEQAAQRHCIVCSNSGATITCHETGCDRSFHLPCSTAGECTTQFFAPYRSFCWEHRPEQAAEAAPEENTTCLICLDPVGDRKSYHTLVCPVCKHAWFHRGCIQRQAMHEGILWFQCPVCRNRDDFLMEMLTIGIHVPVRLPWWYGQENEEPTETHSRCDARECSCPDGREHVEEEGPWQLLLCNSCAAQGTHRRCSHLRSRRTHWVCDSC